MEHFGEWSKLTWKSLFFRAFFCGPGAFSLQQNVFLRIKCHSSVTVGEANSRFRRKIPAQNKHTPRTQFFSSCFTGKNAIFIPRLKKHVKYDGFSMVWFSRVPGPPIPGFAHSEWGFLTYKPRQGLFYTVKYRWKYTFGGRFKNPIWGGVLCTPGPDNKCCWAEKPRKMRIKMQQKYMLRYWIPCLTRMEWCFLSFCA